MSAFTEMFVLQAVIIGGWVIITQSRRLKRLERSSRGTLITAQIGALHEEVRQLRSDHGGHAGRQGRLLRSLDASVAHLETEVQTLAAQVERISEQALRHLHQHGTRSATDRAQQTYHQSHGTPERDRESERLRETA